MTVKIDVFHGECAAWFELVEKSAQSRAGITKVGKNKADINEIIPVIRLWLSCDILRPEVNIRNPEALRFLLGKQDLGAIEVNTRHMPPWHNAAERQSYVTTATSHIQASRIRRKRKAFQECERGR